MGVGGEEKEEGGGGGAGHGSIWQPHRHLFPALCCCTRVQLLQQQAHPGPSESALLTLQFCFSILLGLGHKLTRFGEPA